MIVREYYKTRKDGVRLYRTYSDAGYMVLQSETGIEYEEAIDVETDTHTYEESENHIMKLELDKDELRARLDDAEAKLSEIENTYDEN